MTYFEHTKEHELDCDCSFCLDVDPNKSIAREIERVCEVIQQETISALSEERYRLVSDALTRLLIIRRYVSVQELPTKFERQVADAIKRTEE